MKVLGIDYGGARVGLAMGDTESRVAAPFDVWAGLSDDVLLLRLTDLVKREAIEAVCIGIPVRKDGTVSGQGEIHRAFAKRLSEVAAIPVYEVDESFTSVESARRKKELGLPAGEDALAATLILEDFFESNLWH